VNHKTHDQANLSVPIDIVPTKRVYIRFDHYVFRSAPLNVENLAFSERKDHGAGRILSQHFFSARTFQTIKLHWTFSRTVLRIVPESGRKNRSTRRTCVSRDSSTVEKKPLPRVFQNTPSSYIYFDLGQLQLIIVAFIFTQII
jgi:hypothetical protein